MSAEDRSCPKGVKILSTSERKTGTEEVIAPKQTEQSLYLILASIGSQCRDECVHKRRVILITDHSPSTWAEVYPK